MSKLGHQLIAENRRTKATTLDLGNSGLTEIPHELAELVWLERLFVGSAWHGWIDGTRVFEESRNSGEINVISGSLAPLASLRNLHTLVIDGTACPDLAPLVGLARLRVLSATGNSWLCNIGPIAELKELQSLNLEHTLVDDLTPLSQLPRLQQLSLRATRVGDVSPLSPLNALADLDLSDTKVVDLTPLAGHLEITRLNIDWTPAEDFAVLATLTSLTSLKLSGTNIQDLAPLALLKTLAWLDLSKTTIHDLSELCRSRSLRYLNLYKTHIRDLTPIADLPLEWLDIRDTAVSTLLPLRQRIESGVAVKYGGFEHPDVTRKILVGGSPLATPPLEIVQQGNAAILNYFRERDAGELDQLYEAKVLIVGEGGVGKTSLLRRLYQPEEPLPSESATTRGIAIYRHEFPLRSGRTFRLNVWDFGGQEIYHATHLFFLTQRSLYILVDDTRKDDKSVSDHGFKYWLDLVDVFGGHSPVLIFQNEKGGRSKSIDLAGIKSRYDNVLHLFAGDLEASDAADRIREGVEFFAAQLSHIGDQLPAPWIRVRADIQRRAAEVPYITQAEYFEIYAWHLPFDRTKALHLSRYLHDLGVFLHFQDHPLLARIVVLQNDWATQAAFRILDDETIKAKSGRFGENDCERLWRDSVYADMHPEVIALMQRFELCYLLADSESRTWLAPQLLPPTKPAGVDNWSSVNDLVLRYRYEFMPKGLISRLTVRLHRFVRKSDMAWVTGVILERKDTAALVALLPSGNEVEIRTRGPEKKALLSVIAADLDALNDSFQGLGDRVDKRIPCNCRQCRTSSTPEFFAQKALLRRKEDFRLRVECSRSYEDVDVIQLLDGIRVEVLPAWAGEKKRSASPRKVRIFLASSEELRADRDEFELYFRQLNDRFREEKGLYLEVVRSENFVDAVSETRLQDEYNKAICGCDIFVSLFFSKTGTFTEEEFNIAHSQFLRTGRPRIFTFFKDAEITTGSAKKEDLNSLWAFQERLSGLGHFRTHYKDAEHLKRQFRDQLEMIDA